MGFSGEVCEYEHRGYPRLREQGVCDAQGPWEGGPGEGPHQVLKVQLILDQQPVAEWPENLRIADEDSWGVEWEICRQDAQ